MVIMLKQTLHAINVFSDVHYVLAYFFVHKHLMAIILLEIKILPTMEEYKYVIPHAKPVLMGLISVWAVLKVSL